jgi:hypothetical protein
VEFRLALAFTLGVSAWAQTAAVISPEFYEYPVRTAFSGPPAAPKLIRPSDRRFRTKIREAASRGPNFAGHLTIAEWGCGAGCVSAALVDAKDGRVYAVPFSILGWGMPPLMYEGKYSPTQDGFRPLEYKIASNLLVVRGCPEDRSCASYFYQWTGSDLKLIRKLPAARLAVRSFR